MLQAINGDFADTKLSKHFGEDKTKSILFTGKNNTKNRAICLSIVETFRLSNFEGNVFGKDPIL